MKRSRTGQLYTRCLKLWILACLTSTIWSAPALSAADLNPRDVVMPLLSSTWTGPDDQFVTSSIEDNSGWWWGTDNDGLWHFSLRAVTGQQWQHFRAEDGLYDDSITALCIDRSGRLWVGTERRGVSVYNHSWWQNYDFMTGPLGVHIGSITVNPKNGDVWITSECGLAIYSDTTKSWRYLNTASGLLTDELTCAAFTKSGTAILGTADNGLLLGQPGDNYTKWTSVSANPAAAGAETGPGLPSNQVNCLTVDARGRIYCGTSSGLAQSADSGATWTYLHGWNWQQKVTRYARATFPMHFDEPIADLNDDYIASLAVDKMGVLYIGHRQGGIEVYDTAKQIPVYRDRLINYGTYIRSLTVLSNGGLLAGEYGSGIQRWNLAGFATKSTVPPPTDRTLTTFPAYASSPTSAQIDSLALSLASPPTLPAAGAYFLGEDWQTQGNWVGRYGRQFALLCAADGNQDYMSAAAPGYSVVSGTGINGPSDVSRWLQWQTSGDPRVLYDPEIKNRREAEWDDRGENNDRLSEGPDIWLTVQVPAGVHRLALYFMNNDGHTRTTRFRDYVIQIMSALPGVDYHSTYDTPSTLPVCAETRVRNFWPGVFENFILDGPGTYYVKISRNFSLNTILQGVFLDQISPPPSSPNPKWMAGFSITAAKTITSPLKAQALQQVKRLWTELDQTSGISSLTIDRQDTRILLIRAAQYDGASSELLSFWRIQAGLWTGNDWTDYFLAMQRMLTPPKTRSTR